MRIQEILRRKGDSVVTISPDRTVADLLSLLAEHNIGAAVVSVDGSVIDGIVSERDVVRALARDGRDALDRQVRELMVTDVRTCTAEDELETLARTMTDHRVRHLPVVEQDRLSAIVSIGDIVKHRIDELQAERDHLVNYVQQ